MPVFKLLLTIGLLAMGQSTALALPLGFGHTQGGLEYDEIRGKRVIVYHDKRTPNEARLFYDSLTSGLPILEDWFDIPRKRVIPVITTAVGHGPSFANFITDAIELQSRGQGTRDLAWHELTHTMMYQHFENWLGPAGSILHLAWLPSWFVEGLAEATSVSVGSDVQAGYERFAALTGQWPTYASLHNLYHHGPGSHQGYAISGAMVSHMLRDHGSDALPKLLNDFYRRSMPWHWPLGLVPYTALPFDRSLKTHYSKDGSQIYESYKKAATSHWQENRLGPFLWQKPGPRRYFPGLGNLRMRNGELFYAASDGEGISDRQIVFSDTGWAVQAVPKTRYHQDAESTIALTEDYLDMFVRLRRDRQRVIGFTVFSQNFEDDTNQDLLSAKGRLLRLFRTQNGLGLIIHDAESIRFCFADHDSVLARRFQIDGEALDCPFVVNQPDSVTILGEQTYEEAANVTSSIWFRLTRHNLSGDSHRIMRWQPDRRRAPEQAYANLDVTPQAIAFRGNQAWLLISEQNRRRLLALNHQGQCQAVADLEDTPTAVFALGNNELALVLMHGSLTSIMKVNPEQDLQLRRCPPSFSNPNSPLLLAMRQSRYRDDFNLALAHASPWSAGNISRNAEARQDSPPRADEQPTSSNAKWRVRPVFALPWIGGDSGGYNFGLLSVPLMDHMQNETLNFTTMYGPESRFPTTQFSLTSTKFWPVWNIDAYRQQAWNGQYLDPTTERVRSAYYDERGVSVSARLFHARQRWNLRLGLKMANLRPYIGPLWRPGRLNEISSTLSNSQTFGSWSLASSLTATVAPEEINHVAEYNRLAATTRIARPWHFVNRRHLTSLSLDLSRTRGKRPPRLREFYRPLRIYVPGEPGGFNNLNFPVTTGGGLFSARFGETRAAAVVDYSVPVLPNIDRLVRLFYLRQLQFSSSLAYGGAWFREPLPKNDNLIGSHTYKLDLLFNIKGINFNLGAGFGQVFDQPFESYFNFSFDNILDI